MVKHRNKRFGESNVPNDLIPDEIAIKTSHTNRQLLSKEQKCERQKNFRPCPLPVVTTSRCFCWSAQLGFSFTKHSFDNRTPAWCIVLNHCQTVYRQASILSFALAVSENREPCSHFYSFDNTSYATDKRSPVIYRFNQSTNIPAHLQAFQIDPDFNTLKIFTLTLISKIMKVFTTTTTTTSLYDTPLFYY